jgi:hypothetical protein
LKEKTIHKFKIGQRVVFSEARLDRGTVGVYRVVAQLPDDHGEQQYRIESADRMHLRVAQESQLSAPRQL